MTDTTAPDAITQADRKAVVDYLTHGRGDQGSPYYLEILSGTHDHPLAQAFAAHRRLAAHGAGEGLREAQAIADIIRKYNPKPCGKGWPLNAAKAILALLAPPTDAGSTTPASEGLLGHREDCGCAVCRAEALGSTTREGGEGVREIARIVSLLRHNLEDEDRRMAVENCDALIEYLESGEPVRDLSFARKLAVAIRERIGADRSEGRAAGSLVRKVGPHLIPTTSSPDSGWDWELPPLNAEQLAEIHEVARVDRERRRDA